MQLDGLIDQNKMNKNKSNTFKLGRSIAQLVPFHLPVKQKEIITTKLVITMVIIAIVKIAAIIVYS
jgi:hypothetical protein